MDDSTLISSSKAGMEHKLSLAASFYRLANIRANFNKFDLVTTVTNDPVTFQLTDAPPLTLTPLPPNTSFRYLGVWFNVKNSRTFVRKQLRDMVMSFVTMLRPKLLTATQIVYLVNTILIPRLEYRAMVTPLNPTDTLFITRSYRSLLKNKSRLAGNVPNAFIHDSRGPFRLIDFQSRLAQFHISHILSLLNFASPVQEALQIRLDNLQYRLWLPFSPLLVTDFTPWQRSSTVKDNWLAATLNQAASLHISLVPPDSTSSCTPNVLRGQHPLFELLPTKDYVFHTPKLRSRTLLFLSQLVTNDGNALISWDAFYHQFIRRGPINRTAPWYPAIRTSACISDSSLRLRAQWCVQDTFIQDFVLPSLAPRPYVKEFLAVWHESSNSVILGRSINKRVHDLVRIEHWITDPSNNHLTPLSQPARIRVCPGCSLNSTTHFPNKKKIIVCGLDIPGHLAFTVPLHKSFASCSSTQNTKSPTLTLRDSLHNVHANAFRLFQDFSFESRALTSLSVATSPKISNWSAFDSSFSATLLDAETFFNDAPWLHPSRCDVYIDGSLSHLGTPNLAMGSGWHILNKTTSWIPCHHRSIPLWPSSTRAELSALLSFLFMCPDRLQFNLYTDATSIIFGLNEILFSPLTFRKRQISKRNFILWNTVASLIIQKQLDIRIFKVKAHSNNLGNTLADTFAKAGSSSQAALNYPDEKTSGLPYLPRFHGLPIDSNIRSLIKDVYEAKAFYVFQQFSRFALPKPVSGRTAPVIDWPASWSTAFPNTLKSHSHTSFTINHQVAFASKLFLDELPVQLRLSRPLVEIISFGTKAIRQKFANSVT